MAAQLTVEQRALARRLKARGVKIKTIARRIGCHENIIYCVMRGNKRPGKPDAWSPRSSCLAITEREEILVGLVKGESLRSIALTLGRSPSTISREVAANGGREGYRIWPAHQRAETCSKRPKVAKLDDPALCAKVTEWLEEFWSPQENAERLRLEFPDDPTMHVSHETIYQSLFVQGRGELRRELTRCLRSGRAQRRPQGLV